MKRLILATLALFLLMGCHSKRNVVVQEHYTSDTVYVEKENTHLDKAAFDWAAFGLSFDSLVIETPTISAGDTLLCSPLNPTTKTSLKVYGGNLSHNKASSEKLIADAERSIETSAKEECTKDNKETSEVTGVAQPISLGKWILLIIVVLMITLAVKNSKVFRE